jgi:predicted aldo/keto reductase-like oxidoreductase
MRLPTTDQNRMNDLSSNVDEDLAIPLICAAIDGGVNYVDTGYDYHGGNSERILGRCLANGYRDKIKLATKLPSWAIQSPEDCDRILNEQLERLQTDHIDFYLFHGLNKRNWENVQKHGGVEWAQRALEDGRIHHLGFSFHDSLELFKEILEANDWTFCQIQYNYMDVEHQAGTEGLRYAASRGLGVVVMEPLRGGALTRPAPAPVAELWGDAPVQRTPADWGLQWVWSQPEVALVLSGMSSMQQVEENLASADYSGAGTLTEDELRLIDRVRDAYRELTPIPCTDCRYCMPCPNKVAIPHAFRLYNEAVMYNDHERSRWFYANHTPADRRGDQCVGCGQCEEACPQQIGIIDWLKAAHEFLRQAQTR